MENILNQILYKALKPSGTTFYAFPGAQEDIAVLAQNDNYKISFDKFVFSGVLFSFKSIIG